MRTPLGLASGDAELRRLIVFHSTPSTEHFGRFASRGGAAPTSSRHHREEEKQLPLSIFEQSIARLQEDGKAAYRKGDLQDAIECWSDALSESQRSDDANSEQHTTGCERQAQLYANRCKAKLSLGRDEEALADAHQACALAPRWPKAYYRLGTAMIRCGQIERALGVLRKGFELDTTSDEMRSMLDKVQKLMLSSVSQTSSPAVSQSALSEYKPPDIDSPVYGPEPFCGPVVHHATKPPDTDGPVYGPEPLYGPLYNVTE